MNEMIKAERNKICSRKQTRMLFLAGVVLIVAYFFFFQFNYQNVFYDYDLEKMALASGFTAIEQRKEVAEIFEGKLSQNTLLTMQEKIDQAKQATVGQDENSAFSAVHVYRDQAAILEYLTNSDGSFKSLETAYPNNIEYFWDCSLDNYYIVFKCSNEFSCYSAYYFLRHLLLASCV